MYCYPKPVISLFGVTIVSSVTAEVLDISYITIGIRCKILSPHH